MADEKYKHGAQCRYYHVCHLYNNDVLRPEIEMNMCGRGKTVDDKYVPEVPKPEPFKPALGYAFGDKSGGACEAFEMFDKSKIIAKAAAHIENSFDIFKELGYC